MQPSTKAEVLSFYTDSCHSVNVPNKSAAHSGAEPTKYLRFSGRALYLMFRKEKPHIHISRAMFAKLRPKSVRSFTKNTYSACLCDQCANLELKIEAWNRFAKKMDHADFYLGRISEVSSLTMCPKTEGCKYHPRNCIERTCDDCGVTNLDVLLAPFWSEHADEDITFSEWRNESVTTTKGKVCTRIVKATITMQLEDFVEELYEEINKISRHQFTHR